MQGVHQIRDRLRRDVPVAGVHELGDPEAPALGRVLLEIADLADHQLVGGHLPAGGVVDHVLADLQRVLDGRVLRAALHLVPVAREVLGRIDRHGPAAVLDAEERMLGGVELPASPPDRMLRRQLAELVLLLGEDVLDQEAEALVELVLAAAGVDEQEAALIDVVADVLAGRLGELGHAMAVEEEDRGLEQVLHRRAVGIDDLPGQEALPVARDDVDEVAHVVGVVVPVIGREVVQLVDQHRRAALGQEHEREAGREDRVVLHQGALPGAVGLILVVHQFLGAHAVPVVRAEVADAGQPAGALESVEVVELPLLSAAVVLADLEVAGQPVDPHRQLGIGPALAAVLDLVVLEVLLALVAAQPADDQAGDARAGHAGGGGGRIGGIGPAPVAASASAPSRRGPGSRPRA